jgi:serine-type D-Ala-D-Ala carboxypeptidase (penicillin-binding protein 5/6)
MVRKVKKKKSRIRIFVALLLMVVIVAFAYKSWMHGRAARGACDQPWMHGRAARGACDQPWMHGRAARGACDQPIVTPGNHQVLEKEYDDKTSPYSSLKIEPNPYVSISFDKLNSPNAILIRLKDHTILMQKNSEEKIYPASLTKMMTAIVAIENLPDLKGKIKLTNSTFQGLYEADASMAGFQPGEQVRAIDLYTE